MSNTNLHGVLMQVAGCGVLICGPAGSGKSQLGLELLSRGHCFVGDDLIAVERQDQQLLAHGVGEANAFLALRCGLVIAVTRQFGPDAVRANASIDLLVSPGPALTPCAPLPQTEILGLSRPMHYLQALPGSAICIEALARNWQDEQSGYSAAQDLAARQSQRLAANELK